MESIINRKITGYQMVAIYEMQHDDINVKHYIAKGVSNSEFILSKKYNFEIRIRHGEGTNAEKLFDKVFNSIFPAKTEKLPKKRIYLVSTEVGRIKGRISFYIAEIIPNKGLRLVDNDYTCSRTSNKGVENEAVQALVNNNELPITALTASHYRDASVKGYCLIIVEGRGLNYVNQIG